MAATSFDRIADIIAENSEVPRDKILPDSHVINDLGIDSLDFLDIVFAIDKAFGIKVPVEAWTQEVNAGTAPAEQYFVMKNLVARIDELVAAKAKAANEAGLITIICVGETEAEREAGNQNAVVGGQRGGGDEQASSTPAPRRNPHPPEQQPQTAGASLADMDDDIPF